MPGRHGDHCHHSVVLVEVRERERERERERVQRTYACGAACARENNINCCQNE